MRRREPPCHGVTAVVIKLMTNIVIVAPRKAASRVVGLALQQAGRHQRRWFHGAVADLVNVGCQQHGVELRRPVFMFCWLGTGNAGSAQN